MGRYGIKTADIEARLGGKVRLTDDPEGEPDKMPRALLEQLIDEAESQFEVDVSERYMVPLQCIDGSDFSKLPEFPTRRAITQAIRLAIVVRVLETDFGSGTATDGDKYKSAVEKRYKDDVASLVERRKGVEGGTQQFRRPPLPGLRLAAHNALGDTGFLGAVHVTAQDGGDGDYPGKQINDPSETIWNGTFDP